MSATVYFDNLQSGEVTQLLRSMGHHTVGLRLQRKGDRSPLPGQSWSHDVFTHSGPEVVLVSDSDTPALAWREGRASREQPLGPAAFPVRTPESLSSGPRRCREAAERICREMPASPAWPETASHPPRPESSWQG